MRLVLAFKLGWGDMALNLRESEQGKFMSADPLLPETLKVLNLTSNFVEEQETMCTED